MLSPTSRIRCVNSSFERNDGFQSSWISCAFDLTAISVHKKVRTGQTRQMLILCFTEIILVFSSDSGWHKWLFQSMISSNQNDTSEFSESNDSVLPSFRKRNTYMYYMTVLQSFFSPRTVVILEKRYRWSEYRRFVHFPCIRADHASQFVDQHVELIPPFLLAQISGFPGTIFIHFKIHFFFFFCKEIVQRLNINSCRISRDLLNPFTQPPVLTCAFPWKSRMGKFTIQFSYHFAIVN